LGYFDWGDALGAVNLLQACRRSLKMDMNNPANLLAQITAQCHQRAPLFAPANEAQALQSLVAEVLASST
jgi:hypothetical protein